MKKLAAICTLAVSLLLICGTSDARKRVVEDPILELDEEDYGVHLTRDRTVYDYQAADVLKNADPASTRILVTTGSLTPSGDIYPIAEAISETLKSKFPLTDFKVVGRADLDGFLKMVHENYDYIFVVGTNFDSHKYNSERTVYSQRSTGVRCIPTAYNGGVNCTESSTASVPIGTRSVERSVYSDIFYVTYGVAKEATKGFSTETEEIKDGHWVVSIFSSIGNTSINLIYSTADDDFCKSTVGAQTYLARLIGGNVVSTKPDKFSRTVAPSDIGCED